MWVWGSDPGGQNIVWFPATIQIYLKNHHINRFCMVAPIVSLVLTRVVIYFCWTTLVVLEVR
jgi:hypothetical protein